MSKPEYLKFIEASTFGRRTKVWQVWTVQSEVMLGEISWYGKWRQYTFHPQPHTLFNVGCLTQITKFLSQQNADHAEKLRMIKANGE